MLEPLHELLDSAAARWPQRRALSGIAGDTTYAELEQEVSRVAGWLRTLGVRRGDRVATLLPNCKEVVTTIFAASRLGAIFVVLSDEVKEFHLEAILGDALPAVLLVAPERDLPGVLPARTKVVTLDEYRAAVPVADPAPPAFPGITSDPVCLIYTSGSTATPKGVVCSHRSVRFAAAAIQSRLGLRSDDVVGVFIPLSFDYGLYQVFLTFQAGATLALGRPDQVGPGLLAELAAAGVTGLPVVPSLAAMVLRLAERPGARSLPPLRFVTNTGERLAPEVADRIAETFPGCRVFLMFGLTECKRVSILDPEDFERKRASVGTPLPDTECIVVDERGQVLGPGEVGELVVRGPHVMAGYWNAPALTAERFRPWGKGLEHALFTGDRCSLDDDGYLYFHGRSDDVYKSNGFRVSALEVEAAARDVTGVREAALVPPRGEEGAALYLTGDVAPGDVIPELRKRLEDHKLPSEVVHLEEMPLNQNGKIDKTALRAMISASGGGR